MPSEEVDFSGRNKWARYRPERHKIQPEFPAERVAYIYLLCEPWNPPFPKDVRYVGKALDATSRLSRHLHDARVCVGKGTKCKNWLKSLFAKGYEAPVLKVIRCVSINDHGEAEKYWKKHYQDLGCDLTNHTDGGEGMFGYKPSQETRELWSRQRTGRKLSPEHKAKVMAGLIGRPVSEETREKRRIAMTGKKLSNGPKIAAAKKALWASATKQQKEIMMRGITQEMRSKNGKKTRGQKGCLGFKRPGARSKFWGVSVVRGKFQVTFGHKRKSYYVGVFETELEAARAYDRKVVELRLDRPLNFPPASADKVAA